MPEAKSTPPAPLPGAVGTAAHCAQVRREGAAGRLRAVSGAADLGRPTDRPGSTPGPRSRAWHQLLKLIEAGYHLYPGEKACERWAEATQGL